MENGNQTIKSHIITLGIRQLILLKNVGVGRSVSVGRCRSVGVGLINCAVIFVLILKSEQNVITTIT